MSLIKFGTDKLEQQRVRTSVKGEEKSASKRPKRNVRLSKRPDGGLTIKARIKHGPDDLHVLEIPGGEVTALRKEIVDFHKRLHDGVSGFDSLDADLIDMRKSHPEYMRTTIVGCGLGEAREEKLRGI